MSEQSPHDYDQSRIRAAQRLYGAINSAFEDWESHEIPPQGYDALLSYDVSAQAVHEVQIDPNFSLRQLGIHDLRMPARWEVGIAMQPGLGRIALVGLSMPLKTPGQRLVYTYKSTHDDTFAIYYKDQERTEPLPNSQHPALTDSTYIREMLEKLA